MVRSSFMKLFIAHGVIILLLLFQNCSGGGFSFTSSYNTQDLASAASTPVLTISQAPEPLTSQKSPTFRFSVTTNKFASIKAISCVLDSNPSADCTNGFTAANLSDGDHALKVRAEDSLGNKSEEIVVLWKIDSTKPVVTINQSPSSVIGSTSVGFSFSSDEASVFMCALDNEIMSACTSPVNRTAPEGTHTFKVQSIDSAKNSSDIATATFKVDLTAPIINLLTKPNSPSSGVSATFTYNGTDDGVALSMFSCKLDNQVAAACNSGTMTYSGLTEGSHTFSLTSQDSAGNASPATTYTWIVDTTAPSVPTITANVTNPSKNNTATFLFSATDSNGVKSYECQLDTGAISACLASGVTYTNIVTGSHVFKVRAIDNVGNSSAFTSFSWLVDLSPPVVMLTQTPAASTTATDASFSFTATDTGSGIKTIECQMDAGAFSACTSPKVYSGASVGSHIFNVRVKDQVDNSTTQSFTWSVVAASTPTPTPSPSPTATPSPSPSPTATPAPTPTPVPGSVVFPLHIETGKRYLLDANNNPFFMVGDTPWSLEVSISQADVIKYLDDRKQKGFNTVLFQLMEHCFTVDSSGFNCGTIGKNYYGNVPFNKTGGVWDFTKPIEVYWQQVDFVFAEVAKRNMLALVTPSYVGYGGGEEGWYKDMVSNGATAMRTFGQFVGQRYKNYNNVIWVQGGDYNVADKNLVRSLVAGMKDVLPNSLHTYHGSRYTPSSSFVGSETWLDINTVYTDTTVASNKSSSCYSSSGCGALEIYAQTTKPFFFIEGTYEGMGPDGQGTRSQAYQAILSGAMGQLMGNSPIWFFNSGWQQALNSEGSVSVGMIAKIFAPLKWWLLVPDASGTFLTNQKNRVSYPAAYASDGSFSLVYFTAGTLTINTTMLGGTKVNAYVIDPYNGSKTLMTGSPFTKSTATSFTKTGSNSIGDSDWLLLLEAAP